MFSTKTQTLRIESEIDKSREEGNWIKVIELAEQLRIAYPSYEGFANFLSAEGKLESFLEQTPPIDANVAKAKAGLADVAKLLLSAANQKDKQLQSLDAHLLLGKLYYAMGQYSDALSHYKEADLHSLTEKPLPVRNLRIIAESFAIEGLCLEKTPPSSRSKYKISEWQDQMINCFEVAGDLTLLYLQEQDRINAQQQNGSYALQPTFSHVNKQIGPILETAMQRAPILYIQTKNVKNAIERYRGILSAVESTATQSLRLTLTRQLAEIILRGVRGTSWTAPDINASSANTGLRKITHQTGSSSESPWKPKKYTGPNLFIPNNETEEIILLLLISEAMAVRDAVLSQSQEFKEARIRAFENATAVYDLLSVVVVRWNQIDLLHESFERAMKFSHTESHVWIQYALCLINMGRYVHAYTVLQVVIKLAPQKVMPYLLSARLCYEQLNMIQEGIEWSKKALSRENANPQGLQSRCQLYIGIGHSMFSASNHKRDNIALDWFHKAQQNDPNDHLAEYYLAYEYASKRQINEALMHVKTALSLRYQHIPSLHLFALLLTAQKKYTEALDVINSVLLEYPDSLNFLYIKAHLELHTIGGEEALTTLKNMLHIWKLHYECQTLGDDEQQSEKRSETRSVFQLYTNEMSDKDSNSLRAQSLAASRVEQTLSEVASSFNSFIPKPGPQKAWMLQLQVWLLLAEVYLIFDDYTDATSSLHEASSILPLSHHVMYTRGLLHEYKMEYTEAKQCYQNAISINPSHIKSLQHLGLVYHYLGSQRLAEKTLRDAEKLDPHSHQTWYNLGEVLESLGEVETASEYISKALDVELTNPILPILSIPVTFE